MVYESVVYETDRIYYTNKNERLLPDKYITEITSKRNQ